MKKIVFTFAGREKTMTSQRKFMERAIERKQVDEWHIWDFARQPNDRAWLNSEFGDSKVLFSDATSTNYIPIIIKETKHFEKCRSYHENHTLELLLSPEAQHIWADEQLLHILLLNLIDNACKYSPNESQVRIETRYRSGMTGIAVIDQGCGIPKQFHEDIFREYFRVNPTSMVRGVGLGLPFVKRIVSLHSGHIELVSDAGLGSSFCVWLPRQSFPD